MTAEGRRLDMVAISQHDAQAQHDYALCQAAGLRAVREAARWPIVDRRGVLDLSSIRRLARLGCEMGLTQIWDLMHYGYPDDLDPFSPEFTRRFATYAGLVAAVVREETRGATYYTPVNEISYYAWAAGDAGYMAPHARGRGGELKRALVRAAIAATDAIWRVDHRAKILSVDPLTRLHAPPSRPELQASADDFNQHIVMEAFDLLCGRLEPELGGSRSHLGIVGLNYYAGNQLTLATPAAPQRVLDWDDPEWIPVSDLLAEVQARYGGPIVIAETGSAGDKRAPWLNHLAHEAAHALERGVDLQGICIYPVITTPDWDDPTAFFDGGLFDIIPGPEGRLERVVARPAAAAIRAAQATLDPKSLPHEALPGEETPRADPPLHIVRPAELARFKTENFSHQTLVAGDSLLIELYAFESGASLTAHRHAATEHALTVMAGQGMFRVGERLIEVHEGDTMLAPAGLYHSICNNSNGRLIVQQVSSPKPWDARFGGPHPSSLA